jgi:Spy/CpxP family protein refolding chaperone
MATNTAPRVQAVVLLLLVATAGAVAGIVGDRLVTDRTDPAPASEGLRSAPMPGAGPWRWEARRDMRYGERLSSDLGLTPDQRAAIDSIVRDQQQRVRALTAEVEPQFRAIAEQTRGRVEAVLTPEQRSLADALRRLIAAGVPLDGASDHGVSEALYLRDPDHNGIELYRDRPREEWPRAESGELVMHTAPLDLESLLRESPTS